MLLPNYLVLFSICCLLFQDVNALPRFPKFPPLLAKQSSHPLNVTQEKNQTLLAEAENSAKLGKAIRMFPKMVNVDVPAITKKDFQLWAQPEDNTQTTKSKPQVQKPGENIKSTKDGKTGTDDPKKNGIEELTVSIPKFKTDNMGNWVYNPWGVTFGQVLLDTRFNLESKATIDRIVIDSKAPLHYYPQLGELSTVCFAKSTVYNRPRIEKWLPRKIPHSQYSQRPIVMEMRRELYKLANSEECHVPEMNDWMTYQLCALRRNQRMEYYLPKYPMQQL